MSYPDRDLGFEPYFGRQALAEIGYSMEAEVSSWNLKTVGCWSNAIKDIWRWLFDYEGFQWLRGVPNRVLARHYI
jgi:hypothetical protein